MNARSIKFPYPGAAILAVLGACSSGDVNFPGIEPAFPLGSPGSLQLTETSLDAAEGTIVNIRVARSGGNSGVVSVNYATEDGEATEGLDYTAANGTLTWANGVSGNQTISIPITDDNAVEGAESFTVTLSSISGATLGANLSVTVNIIDNDVATLSAVGSITSFDSVTVNSISFDTNATNVSVNGLPANTSDLKLGQVVAIEGQVNSGDMTGTASEITYNATIIGPVQSIDAAMSRLVVMGQTVLTNEDTNYESNITSGNLAELSVGSNAQVSGFLNADGDVVATRIENDTANADVQIIGRVAELDLANMSFGINRLAVDYHVAALIDLPDGMPANGMFVLARGSLANGTLVVNRLVTAPRLVGNIDQRVRTAGIITRYNAPTDFAVDGYAATITPGTTFSNGGVQDLTPNTRLVIDGKFSSDGRITANSITFDRRVSQAQRAEDGVVAR